MKSKKDILLTFDYEPFLGTRTGTATNCLIRPTNELRNILNKHKAIGVFFVDTLYLRNLENFPELKTEYDGVVNQLIDLYKEGHYIFPHIHPHWIDARYLNNGQFDLSNLSRYSLAKFAQSDIDNSFKQSIDFLKGIGLHFDKWGYRAGGWCIQPFHLFKKAFKEYDIKFEFSVLPGYKNSSETQSFDYSSVQNNMPYCFSDDESIQNEDGDFVEFPISTLHIPKSIKLWDRFIRKILWKTGDRGFGDGLSAKTAAIKTNFLDQEMISIDIITRAKLITYKHSLGQINYMHWISHPKMFTKHGLKMFDDFLKFSKSKYNIEFDFNNMYNKNIK